MTNREALWLVESLVEKRYGAAARYQYHRHLHIRPPWLWAWRRIGVDIGLPLLVVAAFVVVGWGGR